MNNLLYGQIDELLNRSWSHTGLRCESALRAAAGTLSRGAWGEITATSVVCDLAGDEVDGFESLVADIADEYGVEASIRHHPGWYSVRFTSLPRASAHDESGRSVKQLLARMLAR
jgi:hypothetical protein